jgi:hypothetical protein
MITALIERTLTRLPGELTEMLRSPSGRNRGDYINQVSNLVADLSDENLLVLLKSIIDTTVYNVLYVLDDGLAQRGLRIELSELREPRDFSEPPLIERYRNLVEPGGTVAE